VKLWDYDKFNITVSYIDKNYAQKRIIKLYSSSFIVLSSITRETVIPETTLANVKVGTTLLLQRVACYNRQLPEAPKWFHKIPCTPKQDKTTTSPY
jgi:hypothetical protein